MYSVDIAKQLDELKPTMTTYVASCLDVLIENDDDYYTFIKYLQNTQHPFFAVSMLRNDKLANQSLTKNDFMNMFAKNQQKALECLFCNPVTVSDVRLVNDQLVKLNMSVEDIFEQHAKHPELMMLRLMKKRRG